MDQVEAFLPALCRSAAADPSAARGSEADHHAAAALRALQSHLRLCLQLSLAPPHLELLEDAVLAHVLSQRG